MVTLNVAAPPPPPGGALVGEAAAGAGGEAPYLSSPPQESSRTLKITRPSATKRPRIPSFMSSPFDTRASRYCTVIVPLIVPWPWIAQKNVSVPACIGVKLTVSLSPPEIVPLFTTPVIVKVWPGGVRGGGGGGGAGRAPGPPSWAWRPGARAR